MKENINTCNLTNNENNIYLFMKSIITDESDEYKKEHYGSLTLCVETQRKPETFITIKSLSCLFVFFFVVLCPF